MKNSVRKLVGWTFGVALLGPLPAYAQDQDDAGESAATLAAEETHEAGVDGGAEMLVLAGPPDAYGQRGQFERDRDCQIEVDAALGLYPEIRAVIDRLDADRMATREEAQRELLVRFRALGARIFRHFSVPPRDAYQCTDAEINTMLQRVIEALEIEAYEAGEAEKAVRLRLLRAEVGVVPRPTAPAPGSVDAGLTPAAVCLLIHDHAALPASFLAQNVGDELGSDASPDSAGAAARGSLEAQAAATCDASGVYVALCEVSVSQDVGQSAPESGWFVAQARGIAVCRQPEPEAPADEPAAAAEVPAEEGRYVSIDRGDELTSVGALPSWLPYSDALDDLFGDVGDGFGFGWGAEAPAAPQVDPGEVARPPLLGEP